MADATYKLKQYEDGTPYIVTTVRWTRRYGKVNSTTFFRHTDIYSQKQFKAWCKRNKVTPTPEDMAALPKTVWWQ